MTRSCLDLFNDTKSKKMTKSAKIRSPGTLNLDLAKVNEWLIANKLTLSKSKTEFILVGSSTLDKSPNLMIDGKSIKQVTSTNYLGVHIDENLSWSMHIEKIAKKIASGIGA
jgi:hypothetical protein